MNAFLAVAVMFGITICSGLAADQSRKLRPGDYMTITFSNKHDQIDGIYSVSTDGFVNMPFLGKLKAEGLSYSDLKATLEKEYDRQEIYKGLQVSVDPMERPPDLTPFKRDLEALEQLNKRNSPDESIREIESNPFWNKKGDFFVPKDRKATNSTSTDHVKSQ